MSVKLREKQLKNGEVSFYLDIYQNNKRSYKFLGIQVNKKRPTPDDKLKREMANQIRIKYENELIMSANGLEDKNKLDLNFIDYFENTYIPNRSTKGILKAVVKKIKEYHGEKELTFRMINSEWIRGFQKSLKEKLANNTAHLYIGCLRECLKYAVEIDDIPLPNPFKKIPANEKIQYIQTHRQSYTIEELRKLQNTFSDNIDNRVKQLYFFSCFTGLRWSDANKLMWSNIVAKEIEGVTKYYLDFHQTKTKTHLFYSLSQEALNILNERKEELNSTGIESPYIFPELRDKHKSNTKYKYALKNLRIWAEKAGLNPKLMTYHTSRHTFATNLLEACHDIAVVSEILGHKSIETTQIYTHIRDKSKTTAIENLPTLSLSAGKKNKKVVNKKVNKMASDKLKKSNKTNSKDDGNINKAA